jgi:ABC-type multidrug transport system ATPase subunit
LKKVHVNGLQSVCKNSLGVKQGEIVGLLGPNGSGKTTTLKMISMEIPVTSGDIAILDQNILDINMTLVGR